MVHRRLAPTHAERPTATVPTSMAATPTSPNRPAPMFDPTRSEAYHEDGTDARPTATTPAITEKSGHLAARRTVASIDRPTA